MMDELESRIVALQCPSGIRFKPEEFDSDNVQRSTKRHSTFEAQQQDNGFPDFSSEKRRPTSEYITTTTTGNEIDSVKKKNWMLESLGKAFSRKKTRTNSISEAELEAAETRASFVGDNDVLSPTQLSPGPGSFKRSFTLPTKLNPDHLDPDQRTSSAEDSDCLLSPFVVEKDELVVELQRQLNERDVKMKEIRKEAMCSVSQLQELTAIVMEMKEELDSLKAENDRLQRLVKQDGDADPMSSSPSAIDAGWGWPVNASTMTSGSHRDSRRADQGSASAARASSSSSSSSAAASASESSRCGAKFHVIKQHV